MKSILLPMTGLSASDTITKVATDLATRFRSCLTGLFIRPDPRTAIPFMGEGLTADMIQTLCDNADSEGKGQADKAEAAFRTALEAAGIRFLPGGGACDGAKAKWRVEAGEISDHVGRRARIADMAICLQPSGSNVDSTDIFNDLIFRSGRSVLMVPDGYDGDVGRHVMIAWNGRTEGARAVSGALPFLLEAEKVTVVQVGDIGEDRPGLSDISEYLHEHGIDVTEKAVEPGNMAVGPTLMETADTIGADTVVIGAYSHSRWREMVLGGVTRHITEKSKIPVFMSH